MHVCLELFTSMNQSKVVYISTHGYARFPLRVSCAKRQRFRSSSLSSQRDRLGRDVAHGFSNTRSSSRRKVQRRQNAGLVTFHGAFSTIYVEPFGSNRRADSRTQLSRSNNHACEAGGLCRPIRISSLLMLSVAAPTGAHSSRT